MGGARSAYGGQFVCRDDGGYHTNPPKYLRPDSWSFSLIPLYIKIKHLMVMYMKQK
jgi:hypothetical protein